MWKQCNIIVFYGVFESSFWFFFALFSLIIKIDLVKLSMQFVIHLKLNNWNITNQNVLLYVSWHFLSGEVQNIRASKVSYFTFLFSRRSVGSCLSSSSIVVFVFALFLYFGGWGLDLCTLSRQRYSKWSRWHSYHVSLPAGRPFGIKFAKSSDTMSEVFAAFFSSRLSAFCCS